MQQKVEQFAEMLVDAPVNERYHFAVQTKNGIPHFFRVQKVHLAPIEDYMLYVLTDDEGLRDRVFNLYYYLNPIESHPSKTLAVAHIIWDYLHFYNEDLRISAPFDMYDATEPGQTSHGSSPAFERFLGQRLLEIGRY